MRATSSPRIVAAAREVDLRCRGGPARRHKVAGQKPAERDCRSYRQDLGDAAKKIVARFVMSSQRNHGEKNGKCGRGQGMIDYKVSAD